MQIKVRGRTIEEVQAKWLAFRCLGWRVVRPIAVEGWLWPRYAMTVAGEWLTPEEKAMPLHDTTFEYYKPTDRQVVRMEDARTAAKEYAAAIERLMPSGPDKTYALRRLREVAMWVNVGITRDAEGAPRGDE
jgi:hypothetical protein